MSKPRNYWFPIALKMVKQYKEIKKEDSFQAMIYTKAIEDTLEDSLLLPYGDLRVKAFKMLYFDKTHNLHGTASELHVTERTLQRWTNKFVNEVGRRAGFAEK
ncbi:MAG: hypothetical protein MJZ26_12180 [Fibrobacter sp.]|nr:hypothetical protein [Fibrobacter sp.]